MRRFVLVTMICGFLAIALGCGGCAGPVERRLSGNIGLAWRDTRDEMSLVELDGAGDEPGIQQWLVGGTIFSVGWDDSHVIAKQHPRKERFDPFDRSRTEYYIVGVHDKRVHGPFDHADFILHCDILGVAEGLDFTLTFKELE